MKKEIILRWALRIFLTAACILMLGFIFSNSLKTGTQSVQQSTTMVDVVQNVASVVAPNSSVATATGEAYDQLHAWIRVFAHFVEFSLFGALLLWCVSSYTWKKEGFWCALVGVCLVPAVDESLQYFVVDRGAQFCDFCVDVAGGVCGAMFALVVLMMIVEIAAKRAAKKSEIAAKNG